MASRLAWIVIHIAFAKVPDQRRTASLALARHRVRDTRCLILAPMRSSPRITTALRGIRIVAMNKAPGVTRGFACRFLWLVAFSAKNRKSTLSGECSADVTAAIRSRGPRSRGAGRGARSDRDRRRDSGCCRKPDWPAPNAAEPLARPTGWSYCEGCSTAWTRLRVPVCAKAGEAITAASAAVASSVFMFLVSEFCVIVPIRPGIWSRSGLRRNAQ